MHDYFHIAGFYAVGFYYGLYRAFFLRFFSRVPLVACLYLCAPIAKSYLPHT